MSKYVARLKGYSYDGDGEHVHDCYLTKEGYAVTDRRRAMEYDSEADAWEHLREIGEANGDGARVEVTT